MKVNPLIALENLYKSTRNIAAPAEVHEHLRELAGIVQTALMEKENGTEEAENN